MSVTVLCSPHVKLCMIVYKNVCRYHWILLVIKIKDGKIHVLDSVRKDKTQYASMAAMLER